MRLAYRRYSGARGFTAAEFQEAAAEVADVTLAAFFRRALASTEELDYAEALDWFGLRFTETSSQATSRWMLEVRSDATAAQREHLLVWMASHRK